MTHVTEICIQFSPISACFSIHDYANISTNMNDYKIQSFVEFRKMRFSSEGKKVF